MSMRVIDAQAVYDDLLGDLRRLERRLRWQAAVSGLPVAVGVGFALAAVFVAAMRVWPIYSRAEIWQIVGALMAAALAANFALAFLRPRPRIEMARKLDATLGLHERLSTAVDANNRHARGTMVALQVADAARAANAADLRRAFTPHIARRDVAFAAVLGLLLVAALYAPNPFAAAAQQREAVKATQQQVASKIEQVEQNITAAPNADDPVRQQIVSEMEALRGDLANGDLSREQALARLQESEDNLKRLEDPAVLAQKEGLNRLGQELSKFIDPAMQQIANNLQLGNYQEAAQGMHDLANNLANMSLAQREALQQSLAQAAQAIAAVDPKLAALLQQASDALKRGDLDAARQALDAAAAQMGQEAQSIAAQQQLQQALAQVQDGEQSVAQAGQPKPAPSGQTADAGNPQPSGQGGEAQPGGVGTPQPGAAGGTPVAGNAQQPGSNPQGGTDGNSSGQPSSPGNGTPSAGDTQSGGNGAGKGGSNDKVYAPEPVQNQPNNAATPLPLGGSGDNGSGGGKPVGPGTGGAGGSNGGGASAGSGSGNQVPYYQVYKQYSDKANSDLQNSYIPQNLKSYVRDYFTSLTPQQ